MDNLKAQITAKVLDNYCTTDMVELLEEEPDFKTTLQWPIELLKRIC